MLIFKKNRSIAITFFLFAVNHCIFPQLSKNHPLSDYDREALQSIREPHIVGVPPDNAWFSIAVMPDGEIRIYGAEGKTRHDDAGRRIYLASRDAGLSWKTFPASDEELGASVKCPWADYYIRPIWSAAWMRPSLKNKEKGTWIVTGKSPDATELKFYKLSENELAWHRTPLPIKSKKRWIVPGQEPLPEGPAGAYRVVLFLSDDDCVTWRKVTLKSAPPHTIVAPHEGVRWQNGSCEPTIVELDGGKLCLIARTSTDYHYQYFSDDGGETWTEPEPSPFHSTLTMPNFLRLSDGRILFFWCNTQPLPELRHEDQKPLLAAWELNGSSEDVFTNRDANHAAITLDGGKTWRGFREIALNGIRNDADFRSKGGNDDCLDKSVHQFEALELPFGKVLLLYGQHPLSRKIAIFDPDWLLENKREENFRTGIGALSTQVYLKSVSGNFRGFSGHCAWNRTNGAVLVPDPDGNFQEALLIASIKDARLFSEIQGAVWNFPAWLSGKVTVKVRVQGEGLRLSLADRWFNPIDTTVTAFSPWSFVLKQADIPHGLPASDNWTDVTLVWGEDGRCVLKAGEKVVYETQARFKPSFGVSYLHLQSLPGDSIGTLVKSLSAYSINNAKPAPKPLYQDPVYDGAADPVVVWNRNEKKWFMLYTNRRANVEGLEGVSWAHGTRIGVAESSDGGTTWTYRDTCDIDYRPDEGYSFWAPDVVYQNNLYHMFLTYVPGTFKTWSGTRDIIHLTSEDLLHWKYISTLKLSSDRVIDPSVFQLPDGSWRMYYNNEPVNKSMYYADSPNLFDWKDSGKRCIFDDGEGAKVFKWKGRYRMIIDTWDGLGVYSSDDAVNWEKQTEKILREPGKIKGDDAKGQHCDVVVSGDRAFIFYFVHQDAGKGRNTHIQVAELEYKDGKITCDRNKDAYVNLIP